MKNKLLELIAPIHFLINPQSLFKTPHGRKKLSEWSRTVRKRDKKCLKCGSKQKLEAHHIYPKSIYPRMWLRVDNGVTLCKKHHRVSNEAIHHHIKRNEMNLKNTLEFINS